MIQNWGVKYQDKGDTGSAMDEAAARTRALEHLRSLYSLRDGDEPMIIEAREALLFFERHRWELEPRDFAGLMDWIHEYLSRKRHAG